MASLFALSAEAHAQQQSGFGIGVTAGEPSGLTMKLWLDQSSAIKLVAAWSFLGGGSLSLHFDYVVHVFDTFAVTTGDLPWYVGVGAKARLAARPEIGVRMPIGLVYMFESAPLTVFTELAPGVLIWPDTELDFGAGIGLRYFFAP